MYEDTDDKAICVEEQTLPCVNSFYHFKTLVIDTIRLDDAYSAPNVKLPKLNFSVFGLYLFNRSYLEQGNYIFTFSKHFCVSNCGVNLISTRKQSLATCKQITVKSSFFNHNSHQECNSKFKFML